MQPGDVVRIRGSAQALPLFESIVAATIIAGGHPIPVIDLPEANRKALREAPLEYLLQEHTAEFALLEALDVYIEAMAAAAPNPSAEPIPLERPEAARDGRASYVEAALAGSQREVSVGQSGGIPTPEYAEFIGADFEEMNEIFWAAMSVMPDELGAVGARIADVMTAGAEVRVTGPNGTDLTLTLSDEPVRINTGRVSENTSEKGPASAYLPAGEFAACVEPASANGVVVAPSYNFRGEDVTNLSLTFTDGVVTEMSAEAGGEPLSAFLDTRGEADLSLSLVNIGLNPEARMLSGSSFRSWEMGGLMTIFMGDNTIYGCGHRADVRLHPHIEGLTVTAGGRTVVEDGVVTIE